MSNVKIYTATPADLSPPVQSESFCVDLVLASDYRELEAKCAALVEALEKAQQQIQAHERAELTWMNALDLPDEATRNDILPAIHAEKYLLRNANMHISKLERANAAQDDHINQQQDRIAELDKRLIEYAGIATREARRVAELEKYRTAFMEWHDKTAWVQSDKRFDVVRPLGKHRADVLREYIELLEARAAQTLTVRVPVRCDCCYSESEAAMFDGVVAEFREKLELACAIAGIKLQIEGE
ncbi:hypothetical protein [Salmonella enterica]|uniref:hypothetical protein n=1 Tax=Salmonella enterica TaxID=28901 RepID=UPI0026DABF85|nr:hypothetical protein [Salmonella enterica]MDO3807246.1 hypothetical protein [Salmonella enterica]MDO3818798.1 hypothetical protein [Salmonella enterica]